MRLKPAHTLLTISLMVALPGAICAQGPPLGLPPGPPGGLPPGPPGGPPPIITIQVDCDAGESLTDALATPAHRLTVEFEGTCVEDPLIDQDRVTLRGVGVLAEIVGDLTVRGATEVDLADFDVRDSASRNIRIREGAAARLTNITTQNAPGIGVHVQDGSSATITDCSFSGGGFAGLGITNTSTGRLLGTVTASNNNLVGIFISGGATMESRATLEASDNVFGLAVQVDSSAFLVNGITVERNNTGIFMFDDVTVVGGPVVANDNGFAGVTLTHNCTFDSEGQFNNNGFAGIFAERYSTVTLSEFGGTTDVTGNNVFGIFLDGSRATLANTTVSGSPTDIFAEFGAQLDFLAGNSIGGLSCDSTVISRNAPSPCP